MQGSPCPDVSILTSVNLMNEINEIYLDTDSEQYYYL